ncbi:hypothetical protein GCM10027298_00290 [Epidermidibacterium keratini]
MQVHGIASTETVTLRVVRDGARPELVLKQELAAQWAPTPDDAYARGCDWPLLTTLEVDPDCQSGLYLVIITAGTGRDRWEREHFFVVRAPRPQSPYAFLLTTSTLLAYNDWGGANHYRGLGDDPLVDVPSPYSAVRRPIARGILRKPDGAPRSRLETPLGPFEHPRYEVWEWARLRGFSRHHADAFWATYERPFAVWAEREGITLDYLTQMDLHEDPTVLDGYRCLVVVGHDEYWSAQMRRTVDAFVDGGGNVARFAGNFTWQVRIADGIQTCFKAPEKDPVFGTPQQELTTTSWDNPVTGYPSATTFGLRGLNGVYAGFGTASPRGHGGLVIYRPEHWALEGSDLYYGDLLGGAPSRVATFEVDGVDYTFAGGLPFATGTDDAPADLEIIAMGPAIQAEVDRWDGTVPLGDVEDFDGAATFRPHELDGRGRPRPGYGSAMMATFSRGKGTVFNAGVCEWVAGLIHQDWFVEQVTRTVLRRLGDAGR